MTAASLLFCCAAVLAPTAAPAPRGLEVAFVDVEGGAAVLIVTPAGESVLIDSGFPLARDADRILKTAASLGLKRIDHHLITHWHLDHYGATALVAEKLPIGRFYNRGVPDKLAEDAKFPERIAAYQKACGGKSTALKPGDEIPLAADPSGKTPAVRMRVLAAGGETVSSKNTAPGCDAHPAKPEDRSDNARSVAVLVTFGDFRFLTCGDLTWNIEHKLVCPENVVGAVDVYMVTHHGMNISNNPALVRAVSPRVTVMCNGPAKGGHPDVLKLLREVPGIEANYQIHRNLFVPKELNTDPALTANVAESAACEGHGIRLTVAPDAKTYAVAVEGKEGSRTFRTK